ncbi:hypothetical protein BU23DRAFT_233863 [Bimuria novae-zelandiae CBS 107.79]|uniref:Uncharacterized protein n=1 Tax=Bimuria novae-zelandiae CBS 107.79 TaxID=1447943 RepID=A0A6A5V0N6_9PLEO|nr:hypothetical protein BU23DRAFT_233863 [Bimuria novae-zelandiae CBS 107.79]
MTSTHAESTHAHPPTPPDSTAEPVQEHSSLYYNTLFRNGLRLIGLQGADRRTATDVYCPEVRRSSLKGSCLVNHRDVVSCWKGINMKQAEEVLTWERIFGEALEVQISENVRRLVTTLPATDNDEFKLAHHVDIELEALVRSMVMLYFASRPDEQRERTWSMSEGDLPSFAYNFARTRDCFIHASPEPCVRIDLTFSLSSSSIVGEVYWQPPYIDFGDLPDGSIPEASLRPTHQSHYLGKPLGFTAYPDYMDTSLKLSLLTTKINMYFPEGVRFERTSRYCIQLQITPALPIQTFLPTTSPWAKGSYNVDVIDTWVDKYLDHLGGLSTTCIGEASVSALKSSITPSLTKSLFSPKALKSRAYTSTEGTSRVMPALRKNGSVKRVLFMSSAHKPMSPVQVPTRCDSPIGDLGMTHDGACDPRDDQDAIRRNYQEFVRRADVRARLRGTDEASEAEAFEGIFLESSEGVSEGSW